MRITNLNAWFAWVRRRDYATFGHGLSESSSSTRFSDLFEGHLNRHASVVLTYSDAGRQHVIERQRVPSERVVSFGNSTDTEHVERVLEGLSPGDIGLFRASHQIPDGARIALALGTLRPEKRIALMCAAAQKVLDRDPLAWLIVAGDGPERWRLEELVRTHGRVVLLGHCTVDEYAPAASLARILLNPGSIGLIAADALALQLRILGTEGAKLGPEAALLDIPLDLIRTSNNVEEYAQAWFESLESRIPPVSRPPRLEDSAKAIASALKMVLGR